MLRYKSLEEETSGDAGVNSIALQAALSSEATAADASFYVLLRAADRFAATHGRPPGAYDGQLDEDVAQLKATAAQVLSECGVSGVAVNDDYVVEICRCGGCELHVIAALVGGIAAQEAIKLATEQFVPVTGTLVYNGITCTTSTLDL